jgi:hypothetical protein
MIAIAFLFVRVLCDCFKSRRRLEAEILVLRHQLNFLQRTEAGSAIADLEDFPSQSRGGDCVD